MSIKNSIPKKLFTVLFAVSVLATQSTIVFSNEQSHKQENQENIVSLMDQYPEIFSHNNMCSLDTVGDPDGTHVVLFNPDLSQIVSFSCKKDSNHKERGLWKVTNKDGNEEPGVHVTRRTKRVFNVRLKFDKKFKGYRDKPIGLFLENVLGLSQKYKGTLFIDEYKKYPLWNIILKDRQELLEFLEYLTVQNLRRNGRAYFDHKPILRLTLEEDPFLENLELEDIALLKTLFTVVDYRDSKVTKFFNDTKTLIGRIYLEFEASKPIHLGESVQQNVMRNLESFFKDFDKNDLLAKTIVWGGGLMTAAVVSDRIIKPLIARYIPDIFGNYR